MIKQEHQYMVRIFGYLVSRAFSLCLLCTMIALPLAPAFASEDGTVVQPDITPETSVPQENTPPVTDTPTSPPVADSPSQNEVESVVTSDATTSAPEHNTEEVVSEQSATNTISTVSPEENTLSQSSTTNDVVLDSNPTTISTTTPQKQETQIEAQQNTTTTTAKVSDVSETSTTTEKGTYATAEPQNTITTDENRFTFSKSECTTRGDGMFYCTNAKTAEKAQIIGVDRVFAAVDAEGDKEIYIEKDGKLTQITHNQYDDDSPYYDALSNTLVWHRLIDGRYQIMSYDVKTETETQITHEGYNNMEPNRFGNVTVWQGWVGNDWEIFLLEDATLTMVTDNATNDIMPSVNGTHVVWQSFESDVWKMKVYDIRTKAVQTIDGDSGGSIANPRFVLVYDKKAETGDIETHGYDLENGEVINLSSTPLPTQKKIPDPEQTGEKRAIVTTNTTQVKSKTDSENETQNGPDPDQDITNTASSTEKGDVIVPSFSAENTASSTTMGEVQSDGYDLVITTPVTNASTSVAHIEDVVVTPYVPENNAF